MFHPWRVLRTAAHLTLYWAAMPHHRGLTDGRSTIVLHPDMLQVERRCTLAHELVHVDMGHTSGCNTAEERAVQAETARRLIPLHRLADTLAWALSHDEAADELWVTPEVLTDRIEHLTPEELAWLEQHTERNHHAP